MGEEVVAKVAVECILVEVEEAQAVRVDKDRRKEETSEIRLQGDLMLAQGEAGQEGARTHYLLLCR